MTALADQLHRLLAGAVKFHGRRGSFYDVRWEISWSFRSYRLDDHVVDDVMVIHTIDLNEIYRGRGYFSTLVDRLCAEGSCAGIEFDWLAFENCNDTLIAILRHKGFTCPDPHHRRICYRQTRQLLLPL